MAAEEADDANWQRALHSFQVRNAQDSREDLVNKWREVSKPNRQGAVAPKPRGAKLDFHDLFQQWLDARDLSDALEYSGTEKGWAVYKYNKSVATPDEKTWECAFHGTWWYSVWLVLESGVLLESDDREKGHDFWEPGVYCSPLLHTGRWYARPQVLFGDGVYHRIIFELRVDPERRKRNRQRGGVQWVFPTQAVALHAIRVQINAPPKIGEERVNEWDAELEGIPHGKMRPVSTVNPRDLEQDPWPELEPGSSDEERNTVPPHLLACNPWPRKESKASPVALQTPATRSGAYSRLRLRPTNGTSDTDGGSEHAPAIEEQGQAREGYARLRMQRTLPKSKVTRPMGHQRATPVTASAEVASKDWSRLRPKDWQAGLANKSHALSNGAQPNGKQSRSNGQHFERQRPSLAGVTDWQPESSVSDAPDPEPSAWKFLVEKTADLVGPDDDWDPLADEPENEERAEAKVAQEDTCGRGTWVEAPKWYPPSKKAKTTGIEKENAKDLKSESAE